MARTARATIKSKRKKREAAADRRADIAGETVSKPVQSGLKIKRPGMDDLNLDDLANCPAPEDALLLLSPDAAEAMQAVSEPVRIEVCKTIVALGDVVARTHAPLLAAIKLTLREGGGIETTAEANGRIFYRRGDGGLISGFSGGICAVARAESKQRAGLAHAESLSNWGLALVEAGQYLTEMAATARSIGDEIAKESEGPPIHPKVTRARMPGRGGVPMCNLDENCRCEKGHGGPCCALPDRHDGPCTTEPTAHTPPSKCGKFSCPGAPDGCILPKGHEMGCTSVDTNRYDQ